MPVFSRFLIFCLALGAALAPASARAGDATPPMVMEYEIFVGGEQKIPAYTPIMRWEVAEPEQKKKIIEHVKSHEPANIPNPDGYINTAGAFTITYSDPARNMDGTIKVFGRYVVLVELTKNYTYYTDLNGLEAFLAEELKAHDTVTDDPFAPLTGDEIMAVQHNKLVDKRLPFWVVRDAGEAEKYLSHLRDLPVTKSPKWEDTRSAYQITLSNPPEGMSSSYTIKDGVVRSYSGKRFMLGIDDGGELFGKLAKIVLETPMPNEEMRKKLWGLQGTPDDAQPGGETNEPAPAPKED